MHARKIRWRLKGGVNHSFKEIIDHSVCSRCLQSLQLLQVAVDFYIYEYIDYIEFKSFTLNVTKY